MLFRKTLGVRRAGIIAVATILGWQLLEPSVGFANQKSLPPDVKKTLKDIENTANGFTVGLEAFAAVGAAAAAFGCVPCGIAAAGAGLVAAGTGAVGFAAGVAGGDPPDKNYKQIIPVTILAPPVVSYALSYSQRYLAMTINNVDFNSAALVAYTTALGITKNREATAFAEGDQQSGLMQARAAAQYEKQLAFYMAQEPSLLVELGNASDKLLEAAGQSIVITETDNASFVNSVRVSGLPASLVASLRDFGATSQELQQIIQSIASSDPTAAPVGTIQQIVSSQDFSTSASALVNELSGSCAPSYVTMSALGAQVGDTRYNKSADTNDDGVVNLSDLPSIIPPECTVWLGANFLTEKRYRY